MSSKVGITGIGIVSALGNGIDDTLQNLKLGKTGIGPIDILETAYKGQLPLGEVKLTEAQLQQLLELDSSKKYTRTFLLGLIAVRQAVAGINLNDGARTGFISANSVGGMGSTELIFGNFITDTDGSDISIVAAHDCGESTEHIAKELGIKDFVTTISTACSSSANSIMLGARMIRAGLLDRAVVGGVDALTKFTLNGFNTLQILDHEPCRPFDSTRRGLNLGEGAAFLVLENETLTAKRTHVWGQVSGYANNNDAYHQTASSPEGVGSTMAMQGALQIAGLLPDDIDYINAHGTGTENNDVSEGMAIEKIFDTVPPFSSTKAYTGHTLGAAGAIEAVISLLGMQHGLIFPNMNHANPMPELKHLPVLKLTEMQQQHVLSNSFGFGGNCTSLVLSKYTNVH